MKIEFIQNFIFELKDIGKNFILLFGMSFLTNFWVSLKNEFSIMWLAHIVALLLAAIIVKILARWIGEHIEEMSDIEFMHVFTCDRKVHDLLKDPHAHGLMYRANKDYIVYDTNKLKVFSKFMLMKTTETFEVIVSENVVKLKNISGKYESEVVYEYANGLIIAHWIAKPKGLRRAITLFFAGIGKRYIIEDFQKFVDKNK